MATKDEERTARKLRVEQIHQIREANPQNPGEKDKAYWRRIIPILDNADVQTDKGNPWTPDNLTLFWKRYAGQDPPTQPQAESTKPRKSQRPMSSTHEQVESTQAPQGPMDSGIDSSTQPPVDSTEDTELLRSMLADYERAGGLRDLLAWWTDRKGEDVNMPQTWPVIEGGRTRSVKGKDLQNVSTAVYLDVELLERALEKGRSENVRSLSALITGLLWRYIGAPPEMVKGHKPDAGAAPDPSTDPTD